MGTFGIGWVENAASLDPGTITEFRAMNRNVEGVIRDNIRLKIPPSKKLYTGVNTDGTEAPNNLSNGKLIIMTNVGSNVIDGSVLGVVHVRGKVTFANYFQPNDTENSYLIKQYSGVVPLTVDMTTTNSFIYPSGNGFVGTLDYSSASGSLATAVIANTTNTVTTSLTLDTSQLAIGDIVKITSTVLSTNMSDWYSPTNWTGADNVLSVNGSTSGGLSRDYSTVGNNVNFTVPSINWSDMTKSSADVPCITDIYLIVTDNTPGIFGTYEWDDVSLMKSTYTGQVSRTLEITIVDNQSELGSTLAMQNKLVAPKLSRAQAQVKLLKNGMNAEHMTNLMKVPPNSKDGNFDDDNPDMVDDFT
jgi:hypothetical protein